MRRRWPYLIGKPLLMPALAARHVMGTDEPSRAVLTADALSWVGDIALMGSGRRWFLTGVGSFFGAHFAYIATYRDRSSMPLLGTRGRRRFLGGAAALAGGMALAARRQDPTLAAPVAAYGLTLAVMVASAAAVDDGRGRDLLLPGAGLFLVSDALIGVQQFVAGEDSRALEAAVLGTYAVAQALITEGLTRTR
jgi:uncharacterized membrane protein YhhN